ncbi:MAG: hypothetical protein FJW39_01965 [Acidobacteria bacterium]|nr:hypothetical protein [Acidobacteriota bacterium]
MHRILLAALIITGLAQGAESAMAPVPSFWKYVHPKAKVLVGLDLTRIWRSPAGQRLQKEMDRIGVKKIAADQGMGFFPNIDRVLLSSPGDGSKGKKAAQPPGVMAMQGRFDMAAMRRDFLKKGASRVSYKGAEIFRKGASGDIVAALVSQNIMLLGDGPSVRLAMDHREVADSSALRTPLVSRAAELDALYDFWLASEVSPGGIASGTELPGPAKMFEAIEGFEGGVSFQKGLQVAFGFHNKDSEAASQMASALNAMLQLAALGGDKDPDAADMLKRTAVELHDSDVIVSLNYTEPEFLAMLDKVQVRMGGKEPGTRAAAPAGSPAAAPVPPPPAPPKTIRIMNLDGGTREIPFR